MLVDNGNAIDILYWDAYKKMSLIEKYLSPMNSPLYGFTRDYMIPRGTIKLAVTIGDHPRTSTVVTKFFVVDCPSAFNEVIRRRPLLNTFKAVVSISFLIMKFPTTMGIRQV